MSYSVLHRVTARSRRVSPARPPASRTGRTALGSGVGLALALTLALSPAARATGTAVTQWFVIFNHPEACATSPCTLDDLGNPDVGLGIVFATGQVTDRYGRVTLVSSLYEGAPALGNVFPPPLGTGLLDAETAEIHVVLRSHGPAIAALEDLQLSYFLEPGCLERGGPNTCEDVQFAVHLAGQDTGVSEILSFDGHRINGAESTLMRDDSGIRSVLRTSVPIVPEARRPVTQWLVVFNNPAACASSPCSAADTANPEVAASALFATGQISSDDGEVNLVSSVYESSVDLGGSPPPFGPGLFDAQAAEIHVVLREHGTLVDGLETEQITNFMEPSCQQVGGPNACENTLFAIHLPGQAESTSDVFLFDGERRVVGASSTLLRDESGVRTIVRTALGGRTCYGGHNALCLDGRFRAAVSWQGPGGNAPARATKMTAEAGSFWFFNEDNVEIVVKLLDGRRVNGHFWLFASALTNLGFRLTVTDTATGEVVAYDNAPGGFLSVADVTAF